jgi:4-amino-4-deoxy-L-arabinose transferase-like glycosyltransferase
LPASTVIDLRRYRRALFLIIAASTLVRAAVALAIPILDDEAHYWVWAQHLMWGYPDHPPMIAGLVKLSTTLLGDSVLAVRFPSLALGAVSTILIFGLARRLFSPAAGVRAAMFFQVLPAFAASGVMAAPDAPLGAFWLAAMTSAWLAARGVLWAWPVTGLLVGLAIQCKLAGAALAVSVAGYTLTSTASRRWLLTPWPYLALLTGVLTISPLLWWNAGNHWATFQRAFEQDAWVHPTNALGNMLAFLASQLLFYAPLGFPLLVAGIVTAVQRRHEDERLRFLFWCAAPTLIAALLASVRALAKPHYTAPALLAAVVIVAGLWPQWRSQRWLRATVLSSAALTAAGFLLTAIPNPLLHQFHTESAGWSRVANEVQQLLPAVGRPGEVFVVAETYQVGSQIAYATRNRVPIVVPFRGFTMWEPPSKWLRRNGVLVDHMGRETLQRFARTFDRLDVPVTVSIRPGYSVRIYPATGFRGFDSTTPTKRSGRASPASDVGLENRHRVDRQNEVFDAGREDGAERAGMVPPWRAAPVRSIE